MILYSNPVAVSTIWLDFKTADNTLTLKLKKLGMDSADDKVEEEVKG